MATTSASSRIRVTNSSPPVHMMIGGHDAPDEAIAIAEAQRLVDAVETPRAPQFWPTRGAALVAIPITTMNTIDSMREPTPKPATTAAPNGASSLVTTADAKWLDDVARQGGQADVQDFPGVYAEPREGGADHAFPEAKPVHGDQERRRPGDHERPRRPFHSEGGQAQPAKDQEGSDEHLEDGSRSDHDPWIDRIADGAHQSGADHGQAEQRVADRRNSDVGDDEVEHGLARAEQVEERSCEGDQKDRAGDVEGQNEQQGRGW